MITLNNKIYDWNNCYMASEASFCEDNGALTAGKGASRTFRRTECNWKNSDSSSTTYSDFPIVSGTNSYTKYQFLAITGSFNTLSSATWNHSTGSLGAGLRLLTVVTSGYATPVTTLLSTGIDITIPSGAAFGQPVFFSTVGPESSACTSTLTASGYTQYLVTQLVTTTAASPGDCASQTLSLVYTES